MIGPGVLLRGEFWSGFVVGAASLAGVFGIIGSWLTEPRQEGKPPPTKPRRKRQRKEKP